MVSIGKLGTGQAKYYLDQAELPMSRASAVSSGVEDYYVGGSEPAGRWFGRSAARLGLTGEVDGNDLHKILAGEDPATGELLATLIGHSAKACALAFSSDGRRLASGGGDHDVIIWDVAARREERRLLGHRGPVLGVAFHPGGELVASTGWIPESDLNVWDARDGALLKSVRCGTWHAAAFPAGSECGPAPP